MTKNPGYYDPQLRAGAANPVALRASIRDKFINVALKQLAEHGLVPL